MVAKNPELALISYMMKHLEESQKNMVWIVMSYKSSKAIPRQLRI